MHEHDVRETTPKSPKAAVQRAAAPASDLLSLQRLAGNSAVTQRIQRANVVIDELTPRVGLDDRAQMGAGNQKLIESIVRDTLKAIRGPTESSGESSGPSTLPPGGHATMEEEPS